MKNLLGFNYIEVSAKAAARNHLVLFHGFGADAFDLQTLSDAFSGSPGLQFLFPQGPLSVPIGPGWTGRAWWPIDVKAYEKVVQTGNHEIIYSRKPDGIESLRKKLFAFLDELKLDPEKTVLGGFSQGAMLACDLFLNSEKTFKGLMLLSGSLIQKDQWSALAAKKKNSSYFISHGDQDAVLPIAGARALHDLLEKAGMNGSWYEFRGNHEIPPSVIKQAQQYLKNVL